MSSKKTKPNRRVRQSTTDSKKAANIERSGQNVEFLATTKPSYATNIGSERYYVLGFVVALILAVLAVYSNSLHGPFIYDDKVVILENPTVQHLWPLGIFQDIPAGIEARHTIFGRPITNWTFAMNYHFSGFEVWGYHLFNLLIHVISTLVVFATLRRTFLSARLKHNWGDSASALSFSIALLWALHPLHTGAITYITQRLESLTGCFYLLTLYCFIESAHSNKPIKWWVLSVLSMCLGAGSKETIVTAPVVILLYDRTFLSYSLKKALTQRGWCYIGFLLAWILLGYLVTGNHQTSTGLNERGGTSTPLSYGSTQVGVILHYLKLTVLPNALTLDYLWPEAKTSLAVLKPGLVIFPLIFLTVWGSVQNKTWAFIGIWFFIILSPSSSFVPISDEFVNEYRMYLPVLAPITLAVLASCLALNWIAAYFQKIESSERRKSIWHGSAWLISLCITGMLLGFKTYERNKDYSSAISIFSDTVRKAPNNPRAYCALGIALGKANQISESNNSFKKAIELYPSYYEVYVNLGINYSLINEFESAVEANKGALNLRPKERLPRLNLAQDYARLNQFEAASKEFQTLLYLNPRDKEAREIFAQVLLIWAADLFNKSGNSPAAYDRLKIALEMDPDNHQIQQNLTIVLNKWGGELIEAKNLHAGIQKIKEALQINSNDNILRKNLAVALNLLAIDLYKHGEKEDARSKLEEASHFDPENQEVVRNLSLIK